MGSYNKAFTGDYEGFQAYCKSWQKNAGKFYGGQGTCSDSVKAAKVAEAAEKAAAVAEAAVEKLQGKASKMTTTAAAAFARAEKLATRARTLLTPSLSKATDLC